MPSGITINPIFDAVYTASGKNWSEARESSVADSISDRTSNYSISVYGTLNITRVYMEFDLSSVEDPITNINLYIYINSTDKGRLSIVYCGQTNLAQDESDYPLYINNSGTRLSNLTTNSGLTNLSLDLGSFNYDPKGGTSIVLALISNNDFDNSSTSSRSINIDSIEGANPPYIIVNDFIAPISGWNSNIKGISYASVSKISGVDISSISSINGISNR
jgi:hypothetical protein